tara:strand:+ start:662 stop:841 length:180 start_codon:yes stop_codon:yes gene_type:complete
MHLMEATERLKRKYTYSTTPGTVYRVFEVYERLGKDEFGNEPVFVRPEVVDKAKKSRLH